MNTDNTFNYTPDKDEEITVEQAQQQSEKIGAVEEVKESPSTDLVVIGKLDMVALFSEDGSSFILDEIEKQAESIVADITTEKGRKEIASMAYNVSKSKTALDKAGKLLKEEAQKTVSVVNAERKKIRDRLDALRDKIRAPLTEFEESEKARVFSHETKLALLEEGYLFEFQDPTIDMIVERRKIVDELNDRDWQEFSEKAIVYYRQTDARLVEMQLARKKRDEEQAELEELRIEKEAREKKEREDKIAQDAHDLAKKEAEEQAEKEKAKILAQAKADQEKADKEKADAEARIKKANDDLIVATEKAKVDKAQAVQDVLDRQAEEKAQADAEEAKREANTKHRAKINNEAMDAITKITARTPAQDNPAQRIITAIAKGEIPHVSIKY